MQPDQPQKIRKGIPKEASSLAEQSTAPPISYETYNAVIEQLTPLEVRLAALSYTLREPMHGGALMTSATMSVPETLREVNGHDGEVFVEIVQSSEFKIASSDGACAADGRVTFVVRVRVGFCPPKEFWPIFMLRNVKLYTHPALRDLVASLAARAGLVAQPLGSVSVTQAVRNTKPSV